MEEIGQLTNEQMTRLEEEPLQEAEKPPKMENHQATTTAIPKPSQQGQADDQAQMTRQPPSNHQDQFKYSTKTSAPLNAAQAPEEGNSALTKINPTDHTIATQPDKAKQHKQASTTTKETTPAEQNIQTQLNEQHNDTQRSLSKTPSKVKMAMNPPRPIEISPKEWQKHHDT